MTLYPLDWHGILKNLTIENIMHRVIFSDKSTQSKMGVDVLLW